MPDTQDGSQFQFVEWSDVAGPSKNAATRVLIRKQAMSKAAAARKSRGDWGKKNIRRNCVTDSSAQGIPERPLKSSGRPKGSYGLASPPTSVSTSVSSHDDSEAGIARWLHDLTVDNSQMYTCQDPSSNWMPIPPKMPSTGYELLRLQRDFDILDLSALTTFHVSRITTVQLQTSPLLLSEVLQCRQWSYISYIPSRFGHFACLDDAARCVASRVALWVKGEVNINAATISLYTKALDSLQVALNDPVLCMMPETLCATELLSLYELLETTRSLGWAQHAAGARSLLKMRGPRQINDSFDRALFIAQVGPMYTEAILEDHGCFLDEPEWQCALKAVVDDQPLTVTPFSDRGSVIISLWSHLVHLPSLWRSVQQVICSCDPVAPSKIKELWDGVIDLTAKVSVWRSQYEPLLRSIPDPSFQDIKEEKRFETLGMCLVCILILKRLKVALDPLDPSALTTEIEAEDIAEDLLVLEKIAIEQNPRAGLFMAFKKVAADAALATKDDWRVSSVIDARVGTNGLIARWVFERWCRLKGRRV